MKLRIFSSNSLRSTSKGQVWIPVFIAIGFLMAFPVAGLMQLGNWNGMEYLPEEISRKYMMLWRDGYFITGMMITFGAAFINGVNGFWYLYSSAKVDFYHGLPAKRNRMFVQKTVTGLVYYFVPYIIMEFLAVCVGAMRGHFSLVLMGLALKLLVLHLVIYLMCYFCVVLAVCLTGNLLMGALMLGGIVLYGPVLGLLLKWYMRGFFNTFENSSNDITGYLIKLCSPLALGNTLREKYYSPQDEGFLKIFVIILIVTAAVGLAAYFSYVKRPMESAGKSMAYKTIGTIVQFMFVIPSALGVGMIFYATPTGESRIYWWCFGLLFGLILAHGTLQVIYSLDFRKFLAHRVQLGIAGICVIVCALGFKMDLTGYDSYIPAYEKVEGLATGLEHVSGLENVYTVIKMKDDEYQIHYPEGDMIGENLGNSKVLYQVVDKLVKNQESYRENGYDRRLPVKYMLKSGREVCRSYMADTKAIRELLTAGYESGTLKESKYSFLKIDNKYLTGISGTFMDNSDYALFQGNKEKLYELAEAYAKDVEEADAQTLISQPCVRLEFRYEKLPVVVRNEYNPDYSYWTSVYVYPDFKRTVAILEETGYPLSMEDIQMESMTYSVYDMEHQGTGYLARNIKVEDKELLEKLKDCLIPYSFDSGWLEIDEVLEATVKTKNSTSFSSMLFIKDKIPEFIREQIKAHIEFDSSAGNVSEKTQVDYS